MSRDISYNNSVLLSFLELRKRSTLTPSIYNENNVSVKSPRLRKKDTQEENPRYVCRPDTFYRFIIVPFVKMNVLRI